MDWRTRLGTERDDGTGTLAGNSPTISVDSQLELASNVAGTAVVTVSYAMFGSTYVDGQTSFTFTAVPQTPSTKSDCMADGWRGLVDAAGHPFKNQGACIAFLNGA